MTKRIAIIGAGISGLSAAQRLLELLSDFEATLFDDRSRAGGVLETVREDGYLIEASADMFTTNPADALELCEGLGAGDGLIETCDVRKRAFIFREGKLFAVPDGFSLMMPGNLWSVLHSDLLSWSGKQRLLEELNVPRAADGNDESLQQFATRRLGREVFERLVQPLASGIYTADPSRLSMRATMKRFLDMEQEYGSLVCAGIESGSDRSASGARYGLFRGPAQGFGWLIETLVDKLQRTGRVLFEFGCRVSAIEQRDSGWSLSCPDRREFDGVVVATSANVASQLSQSFAPQLAETLGQIETASVAIVALGFERAQMAEDFGGFGILYPSCEQRELIAISFSSNKFEGRAADGKVLVRCFIGGALREDLLTRKDPELVALAVSHLREATGFYGEPQLSRVFRWDDAMPQYHVGHLQRIEQIEAAVSQIRRFELAGNSYHGVGIPVCIRSGREAANRLASAF